MFDPRVIISLCIGLLILGACATTDEPSIGHVPYQPAPVNQPDDHRQEPEQQKPATIIKPVSRSGLNLPHMQGREVVRLALLLPFTAKNEGLRDQARSMLNAAQLAVFEINDRRVVLIPKDTGGTRAGAAEAARSAINDGAHVLVGPLLSRAVEGAASQSRRYRVPLIGFSTDSKIAGDGVYLLNFLPEVEVARIIDFAASKEIYNFALLRGVGAYGGRIEQALRYQALANAGELTNVEVYSRSPNEMNAPVARLAQTDLRNEALKLWKKAGGIGDPALDPEFLFELPYQAVLIPESGIRLQSLAPLLPYYDVDPRLVKFLGTGRWFDKTLTREPALNGGWFPGPDQQSIEAFNVAYRSTYSAEPERLASLAYDAILVASSIVETQVDRVLIRADILQSPIGFNGATGLFRFDESGLAEHKLAIYEMRRGRFVVIDPAATEFEPLGF
ncbi:MAG: penicillin-binding protein activator [Robiginitomaculum sp.]|nr:penicillin-binding protein activator [Robiginitomaculum sp.]